MLGASSRQPAGHRIETAAAVVGNVGPGLHGYGGVVAILEDRELPRVLRLVAAFVVITGETEEQEQRVHPGSTKSEKNLDDRRGEVRVACREAMLARRKFVHHQIMGVIFVWEKISNKCSVIACFFCGKVPGLAGEATMLLDHGAHPRGIASEVVHKPRQQRGQACARHARRPCQAIRFDVPLSWGTAEAVSSHMPPKMSTTRLPGSRTPSAVGTSGWPSPTVDPVGRDAGGDQRFVHGFGTMLRKSHVAGLAAAAIGLADGSDLCGRVSILAWSARRRPSSRRRSAAIGSMPPMQRPARTARESRRTPRAEARGPRSGCRRQDRW